MNKRKTTNTLLLIIALPVVFIILKSLAFILIPLIASMFIALLFLPNMRWMAKKKIPKPLAILAAFLVVAALIVAGAEVVQISVEEILTADEAFLSNAQSKIINLIEKVEGFLGMKRVKGENVLMHYSQNINVFENVGATIDFVTSTLTMLLLIVFFVVLLLYESINFEEFLSNLLFKNRISSAKLFMRIEKDIIRFVRVKFVISFFTGLGFSLACLFFDVNFPIFWGLFAFAINFVQMIGSVISVIALSLFAFIEMDPSLTLLFFILAISAVQVLMGAILEPVFMGKTFSINVITVVVMLSIWGYIWGVPGLIMSIPITVMIKIILDKFPNTRMLSKLMS